ncbi:MAG: hypothetical protein A2W05_09185 [Candidatus Schekmanbacteria bacterium RBG_16_38_10]|uniref:Uncharacterized protein n=1 Tax=Candidatus Schekmanbacteria bacterium RBG_16_38_10 TaxID=1817879 RepID=A0A1F7S261_9BACT|nr:MAG: hypothetical protein A2W05_09185 [Candidatus Schekmanbacteria bacterium RBG_16_38_10]
MSEKKGFKECPFCGKEVNEEIVECPYCKRIFRLGIGSRRDEKSHSFVPAKKSGIKLVFFVFGFILVALLLFYFYLPKRENGNKIHKPVKTEKENKITFTEKNKTKNKENSYESGSNNFYLKNEQKLNENISDTTTLAHTSKTDEIKVSETLPSTEMSFPEDIGMGEKKRSEASVLYEKGISFEEKGKLDLAEEEILASIKIDPSTVWAHYRLGIIYLKKGRDESAIKEFEETLKLDKKIAFAHYQIGKIYQKRENFKKAINEFKETVEIDSSFLWAHYRLAVIYKKIGNEELSKIEFEIYNSLKEEAEDFKE